MSHRLFARFVFVPPLPVVSLLVFSACPDRQLAKLPISADVVETTNQPLDNNRDIDILFVIDNSGSMEAEQESLAANFPLIIDTLKSATDQASFHFGVISTDIGGGELCEGSGDQGRLLPGPTSCNAINDGSSFLADLANDDGTRTTNYDGDLGAAFSCLARLGKDGCGFEQPLEALRRAIDAPENASFFRDKAYLAVVFITDEDDCSISSPALMRDSGDRSMSALTSELGPEDSFRCFEFGVKCESSGGPRDEGLRKNCIPAEDSPYLNSVASYVEHLRGSKRFPSQILVAAIAGDLEPVRVVHQTSNIFTQFPIPQLAFSCEETLLGQAVPPIRLQAFLNAFPGNLLVSICQDNLTSAVSEIASFFPGPDMKCIEGVLADTSDEPGLQPDCSVVEVVDPGLPTEVETVLRECDNPSAPTSSSILPCYLIDEDADCASRPSGLALEVFYPERFIIAPFTRAEISCVGVAPL